MKKMLVTRDEHEVGAGKTVIAIWEGDLDSVKLGSDGLWEADHKKAEFIDETTVDEFTRRYGLNPPGAGSKKTLITEYSWEE